MRCSYGFVGWRQNGYGDIKTTAAIAVMNIFHVKPWIENYYTVHPENKMSMQFQLYKCFVKSLIIFAYLP